MSKGFKITVSTIFLLPITIYYLFALYFDFTWLGFSPGLILVSILFLAIIYFYIQQFRSQKDSYFWTTIGFFILIYVTVASGWGSHNICISDGACPALPINYTIFGKTI